MVANEVLARIKHRATMTPPSIARGLLVALVSEGAFDKLRAVAERTPDPSTAHHGIGRVQFVFTSAATRYILPETLSAARGIFVLEEPPMGTESAGADRVRQNTGLANNGLEFRTSSKV